MIKTFDLPFLIRQINKSREKVLANCSDFSPVLVPSNFTFELNVNIAEPFESTIAFSGCFKLKGYIALSGVSISHLKDHAVECILSLGMPQNLWRYHSEYKVLRLFAQTLQGRYKNGRIQKDSDNERVYTWMDGNNVISFISLGSADSGVHLGVQIRETSLHPLGNQLLELYNRASDIRKIRR
jgi:hypothetical protein